MKKDIGDLEKYLGEFRPREVRPLQIPSAAGNRLKRWTVAAMLLICLGGVLWYGKRMKPRVPPSEEIKFVDSHATLDRPNVFALTKLASEDEQKFDAELDVESRSVLPSFQGANSTLSILAKGER